MNTFNVSANVQSSPTITLWISSSNLIEEDDQSRLIELRDVLRDSYLEIGDITNKYITGNFINDTGITSNAIYGAIGALIGKSARTIRYYAEVSAFYYDKDVRSEYNILPFSFLAYAKTRADDWKKVLEYALENPGITKKKLVEVAEMSEMSIDMHLDPTMRRQQNFDVFAEEEMNQKSADSDQGKFREHDDKNRFITIMLVNAVMDLLDRIGGLLLAVPLPEDVIKKIETGLSEIRSVIPYIKEITKESRNS